MIWQGDKFGSGVLKIGEKLIEVGEEIPQKLLAKMGESRVKAFVSAGLIGDPSKPIKSKKDKKK